MLFKQMNNNIEQMLNKSKTEMGCLLNRTGTGNFYDMYCMHALRQCPNLCLCAILILYSLAQWSITVLLCAASPADSTYIEE